MFLKGMMKGRQLSYEGREKEARFRSNKCLTLAREAAFFGLVVSDISHASSGQIVNNLVMQTYTKPKSCISE